MKYETRSKNCYCARCGGWAAPPPPNHRKDQGLFSEITLECLTRPGIDRHTKKELVSHSQHEKKHPHLIGHLRPHSRRLVASEMKRPLAGVTH